jgi:7,8-dihydro-6-hydroxymethylpterin-pyrophosphokinase
MTSPTVYRWQTPYDSAVLEMDLTLIPTRVKTALQAIEERLRSCIEYGSPEHRAIEDARRSLASLHRQPK